MCQKTPNDFIQRASQPLTWLATGVGHMRSAYVLWAAIMSDIYRRRAAGDHAISPADSAGLCSNRFVGGYAYLAGMAIENAIKGLRIAKGGLAWPDDDKLPHELGGSHQLMPHFHSAGVTPNEIEEQLIEHLSKAVHWKGRYCTPRTENDYLSGGPGITFFHPREITALFRRVAEEYPLQAWCGSMCDLAEYLKLLDQECPALKS